MDTKREISVIQSQLKEAMAASKQGSLAANSPLIDEMAYVAARFFEAVQKPVVAIDHALALPEYGKLVSQIMSQAMKGTAAPASLVQLERDGLQLTMPHCPFTDWSAHSQHVCHFIFSIAGHIAARRFGYAKVCYQTCPKSQDGACDVSICTDVTRAGLGDGYEYWSRRKSATQRATGGEDWLLEARAEAAVKEPALPTETVSLGEGDPTMVVRSRAMHRILRAVKTIAPTSVTVLISGETGVGKELVARAVHALSNRSDRPFVALNCGAIPETLIESTLFGHERGAFTGAHQTCPGVFERAQDGTLFLDEIDSLSPAGQLRLLRVLQEGDYTRVGGRQILRTCARIVTATNRQLEEAVRQGDFRQDLFYRFNVLPLAIPPLRERAEDIPALVEHILTKLNHRHNRQITSIPGEIMRQLMRHDWPGNVRELENVLERSFLFSIGTELELIMQPLDFADSEVASTFEPDKPWRQYRKEAVADMEKKYLKEALARFDGNVCMVAALMDLTKRAIYMKLHDHHIDPGAYKH
jgi:DNA-binding NtrC family response regulator